MEETVELCVGEDVLHQLYSASNSSSLQESLELLIEISRTSHGRAELALKQILPVVILLIQYSGSQYLAQSMRLLRNLCAGEIANQNSFIQHNGVGILMNVLMSATRPDPDNGLIRIGLQTLANVSLAGQEHQLSIWNHCFPQKFLALAEVRSREVCDPLCMVIYVCCDGNSELLSELCSDSGLPKVAQIVRTAASGEKFFVLLVCLVLSLLCCIDFLIITNKMFLFVFGCIIEQLVLEKIGSSCFFQEFA